MRQWIRSHLTFANVVSVISLFVAIGGTATAAVIITSNSQVAKDTISGHNPPTGDHSNIISSSVNGNDLATGAVSTGTLGASAVTNPKIANGAVTAGKLKIPATFTSAGLPDAFGECGSLSGTWANWSPDINQPVAYYRGPNGIVHLQGSPAPCNPNGPIFTLPPGYRPARRSYFLVPTNSGFTPNISRITVYETGAAGALGGPGDVLSSATDQVSLDGISFRCGPSGVNGCP